LVQAFDCGLVSTTRTTAIATHLFLPPPAVELHPGDGKYSAFATYVRLTGCTEYTVIDEDAGSPITDHAHGRRQLQA